MEPRERRQSGANDQHPAAEGGLEFVPVAELHPEIRLAGIERVFVRRDNVDDRCQ